MTASGDHESEGSPVLTIALQRESYLNDSLNNISISEDFTTFYREFQDSIDPLYTDVSDIEPEVENVTHSAKYW